MAYVQPGMDYRDESLDGFFSAIGGAFKKTGSFVARKVAPTALSFVPGVGGTASSAYSRLIARRPTPTRLTPRTRSRVGTRFARTALAPVPTQRRGGFFQRVGRRAIERLREDPELREQAIRRTAQYIPPQLIAAAAARQAAEAARAAAAAAAAAPPAVKIAGVTAATLLPMVAIGAMLLRSK